MFIKENDILPGYISKHNSAREKQIIILTIPNKEKEGWHYLAVKKLSALLHRKTFKHNTDFCCLTGLNSFRRGNKLKSYEKVCKNKNCNAIRKGQILEFKQYVKSDKMPYIIYADIESLIRKVERCTNNQENTSTTKIGQHIPCGYSMSTIWGFDQNFCDSLREHAKV